MESITRNRIIVYKLSIFATNTGNHTTVCKLFVLDRNARYHITVQKLFNKYTKNVNINLQ